MKTKYRYRFRTYIVTVLLAMEIMLSFSAFGYISIGNVTLSFVPIIIYVMAYLYGTKLSILAGFVFGLTSMWIASVGAGTNFDYLYSPVLSGNPVASVALAMGTRLLLGLMVGYAMKAPKKYVKHRYWSLVVAVIVTQIIYTVVSLIVAAIGFPETSNQILDVQTYIYYLVLNFLAECMVFFVAVVGVDVLMKMEQVQTFLGYSKLGMMKVPYRWAFLPIFGMTVFFLLFSGGTTAQYLSMSLNVLAKPEHHLNGHALAVLLQLEIQQLVSNTALSVIMIVFAMMVYFYYEERQEKLAYRADRDMMTGLYNREAARKKIRNALLTHEESSCAFLMIDIDGLKEINDTLGHAAGDEAIIGMANVLKYGFRESDVIGRIGGDEFIVFLEGIASKEALISVLERLQKSICEVPIAGETRYLQGSIGVRLNTVGGRVDMDEMFRQADEALYRVKKNGKNGFAFYE